MSLSNGFSFFELLVVLFLATTLAMLGFHSLLASQQKSTLYRIEKELINALQLAKNEAISTNSMVTLAPLNASKDWSKGMFLYAGKLQEKPLAKKIFIWAWSQPGLKITWQGFYSSKYIIFSPDMKSAALTGHFMLCLPPLACKKLVMNRLGRIRAETYFSRSS